MGFIDLHIHTTASDGSFTPTQVVEAALDIGLYAISITDHDTLAGIDEALAAAYGRPIKVIPGVEISSLWNGREIHILGYNFDRNNQFLIDTLAYIADLRMERNEKICELLQKNGVDLSFEDLYTRFPNGVLTRGNIARLLLEKKYVESMAEAFDVYIGNDCPCYVPKFRMSAEDAVKLISFSGGICSLAHPVQYRYTESEFEELFGYLRSIGFKCVEAIHSDNRPGDEERFTRMAAEARLKITGGSDFHGASKPDIHIGTGRGNLRVPKKILANIGIRDYRS